MLLVRFNTVDCNPQRDSAIDTHGIQYFINSQECFTNCARWRGKIGQRKTDQNVIGYNRKIGQYDIIGQK